MSSPKTLSHPWDLSIKEALDVQRRLSSHVLTEGHLPDEAIHYVAGCDLAFHKPTDEAIGALVILSYPDLVIQERVTTIEPIQFPYVPGLLSFREGPVLLNLFKKATIKPDLILFDGHGQAHPRSFGVASHVGLLLGIPSIGVAKSRLCGFTQGDPGEAKGAMVDLFNLDKDVVGRVMRTRSHVSPVYISVGHGLSLDESCRLALACTKVHRLPEPTRLADKLAAEIKKKHLLALKQKTNHAVPERSAMPNNLTDTPCPLPSELSRDEAAKRLEAMKLPNVEDWLSQREEARELTFKGDPAVCSGEELFSLILKEECDRLYNQANVAYQQIHAANEEDVDFITAIDTFPSAVEQAFSLAPQFSGKHLELLKQYKEERYKAFCQDLGLGTKRELSERIECLAFWEDNADMLSQFRKTLFSVVREQLEKALNEAS